MSEPERLNERTIAAGGWSEARALIWAHRTRLAFAFLLILVNRAAGVAVPSSAKWLVDDVLKRQRWELLPAVALGVAAVTLVQAATSFWLAQLLGVAAKRAVADIRTSMHAHVLRLRVRDFDSTTTGVLISRIMTDAEGIRNLVGGGVIGLVGSTITATFAIGVLLYLNWRLAGLTLVLLGLLGGLMLVRFMRLRPSFRERWQITAEISGRLAQSLGGIRVVKAYRAERREALEFAKGTHRLLRLVARVLTGTSAISALSTLIQGAIVVAIVLVGGLAVRTGAMTLGDLLMFSAFTALTVLPLEQIASISTQLGEALAGLDRIREIRRMATEDEDDAGRLPLPDIRGDVEFDDVSFEYEPGVPVLKHVSFRAPAGSTTALVGSSGSGKSTLTALVMTFNRPQSGRVLVDGRDVARIRLRDYRSHLGVVLQEDFLFDGTIAENIAYAKPRAGRDAVEAAGRIAHCDGFVRTFAGGYDTVIGERGVRLSGGQRQRVAIARALMADARILVLDEATSSLDSESEALVQAGLRSLRRGRTTFVIAHRLSTIRSADQILVLEGGEIVERGAHDELLAKRGRYWRLYDRQHPVEAELTI